MENNGFLLTGPQTFQPVKNTVSDQIPFHNVLLRIRYCGICGGDYSYYLGRRPEYPKSLGHEFVGEVMSIGAGVERLQPGDLVISDLNYRCGKCFYCGEGKSHLCLENNAELFSNRAFFEYMVIDTSYLYKIDLPEEYLYRASLIEPLSCVIHACNQFRVDPQDKILINGCGSIGMLACFYLKEVLGYRNITVCDVNTDRRIALAEQLWVQESAHLPEESFDAVFECTNSTMGAELSLRSVRRGGPLCVMSHLYGEDTSFIYEMVCKRELCPVFPLRNGEAENLFRAADMIKSFWPKRLDSLIKVFDLRELPRVFQERENIAANKQIFRVSTA